MCSECGEMVKLVSADYCLMRLALQGRLAPSARPSSLRETLLIAEFETFSDQSGQELGIVESGW